MNPHPNVGNIVEQIENIVLEIAFLFLANLKVIAPPFLRTRYGRPLESMMCTSCASIPGTGPETRLAMACTQFSSSSAPLLRVTFTLADGRMEGPEILRFWASLMKTRALLIQLKFAKVRANSLLNASVHRRFCWSALRKALLFSIILAKPILVSLGNNCCSAKQPLRL